MDITGVLVLRGACPRSVWPSRCSQHSARHDQRSIGKSTPPLKIRRFDRRPDAWRAVVEKPPWHQRLRSFSAGPKRSLDSLSLARDDQDRREETPSCEITSYRPEGCPCVARSGDTSLASAFPVVSGRPEENPYIPFGERKRIAGSNRNADWFIRHLIVVEKGNV